TSSPSPLSQRRIVPSSMESDRRGMTTSATTRAYNAAKAAPRSARGRLVPTVEQRRDALGRLGAGEVVALRIAAADAPQLLRLRTGLHALGDGREPQRLGQPDDRGHDGRVLRVAPEARHEGLVDLELVDRKP